MKEEEQAAKEKEGLRRLPVLPWMRSPIDVALFNDCPLDSVPCLDSRLKEVLQNMGMSTLFPIQVAAWHETIGPGSFERDLCINSPTGSGKTLAYALPIVQALSSHVVRRLRALVVLPTRDLALQVKEVFDLIAPPVGLSVGLAVGQSSIANEISEIIERPNLDMGMCYDPGYSPPELQSAVDILVATPGRLMDHINSTLGFTLEHLCYLVVDETDRLLRESYQSWLPTVLEMSNSKGGQSEFLSLPSTFGSLRTIRKCGVERGFKGKCYPRLVKLILSATLTQDPGKLAQLELHHPLLLTAGQKRYQFPETLQSYMLVCRPRQKPKYLVALLQSLGGEKTIVFTSSLESTHRLCALLNFFTDLQLNIKEYSGLQRQSVRSKTLKAFRKGDVQVLVSSDAMTRGMDVEGVKNVINYDMPPYIKTYIHRAGRTARAGQTGRCITLLQLGEMKRFKKILSKAGGESCPAYPLPSSSLELLDTAYTSALEKLQEAVESDKPKKRKIGQTKSLKLSNSPGLSTGFVR
ncbi:hypothetical protein MLD38_019248 [Melastoma candidum]|uniref:Uncharacterized protein n=1 Tax=Melastoma candidum TaxID=119954 RepID=A0ACB9QVV1_9MYRT|nr:hypothetical protein MLD38_019248 [Melastoma candidum]